MRRSVLLSAVLSCAIPLIASAQVSQPSSSSLFTIEVITLRSVQIDYLNARLKYERSGTKPTEYRSSSNSNFTGASWLTFKEGSTTSTTIGRTTWIAGYLTPNPQPPVLGACGDQLMYQKVFFQFRGKNSSQQTINSNIVSDSVCTQQG